MISKIKTKEIQLLTAKIKNKMNLKKKKEITNYNQ